MRYFASGMVTKYCDQRVCLFVCLFFYLSGRSHISKTTVHISSNFLYMLPVTVARSFSDGNATRYVLPVLWMTSRFRIIERMDRIRDDAYVWSSSPAGGTGAKSAVSNCVLWEFGMGFVLLYIRLLNVAYNSWQYVFSELSLTRSGGGWKPGFISSLWNCRPNVEDYSRTLCASSLTTVDNMCSCLFVAICVSLSVEHAANFVVIVLINFLCATLTTSRHTKIQTVFRMQRRTS